MSLTNTLPYVNAFGGPSSSPQSALAETFPSNLNPQDTHLHATLQRIDELANQDVEMQAPILESSVLIVLDTNILLHHFEALTQFVEDVERQSLPVTVVIPGAVIYELDGQKSRMGLAWFARRASAWLLKKVKERKSVRGQANEETCKASGNWKTRVAGENFGTERVSDALILDCCLYFRRGCRTFMCSADNNLCFESQAQDIPTISPTRHWCSHEIAWGIYGDGMIDLSTFGSYSASYKDRISVSTAPTPTAGQVDDDSMNIDDDGSVAEVLQPSHALDLLHIQVIDHFTRLLVELVGRVGGSGLHRTAEDGCLVSRHAPQWQLRKQHYSGWNAAECLEYLESIKGVAATSPRVEVFLSRPYSERGARRGQDWSPKDWEVGLEGLGLVGDVWEEGSIRESICVLRPHLQEILMMKMRPTGI